MPPRRISVLSADPLSSACARLRLADPIRAAGMELNWHVRIDADRMDIDINGLDQADLIVIQRTFPRAAGVETLLDIVFALGIPVIYEVDDLLTGIPTDNPMAGYSGEAADVLAALMERCAAVTVSTPTLAEHYRRYNPRVYVQPNPIDESCWTPRAPRPARDRRLRIGFAGSNTHRADLRVVEDALVEILERYGERVELCLFGCETERLAAEPRTVRVAGGLPYDRYAETLGRLQLDIGIAPLADNPFNRTKSDIKWLEYSMAGIAGVFSHLPPYEGIVDGTTGLLAGAGPADWVAALTRLIEDDALRCRIAAQAQAEVLARRTLRHSAAMLADTYDDILRNHSGPASGRHPVAVNANRLRYAQWLDANLASPTDLGKWSGRRSGAERFSLHAVLIDDGGSPAASARTRHALERLWRAKVRIDTVPPGDDAAPLINAALTGSDAEWTVLLWPGDLLAPSATWYALRHLERQPGSWAIYLDEDSVGPTGGHDDPVLKPDFDLHRLRCANYLGRSVFLRRAAVLAHGGLAPVDAELAAADAVLRLLDAGLRADGVAHIARLALHRSDEAQPGARRQALCESYAEVVTAHLARRHLPAAAQPRLPVQARWPGTTLRYQCAATPLVSVIIPTRDGGKLLQRCLETLVAEAGYPALEILVLDNQSRSRETLDYLDALRGLGSDNLRVLPVDEAFNFSRLANLGAAAARGDLLLFLNDDTASLNPGWLADLAARLAEADVGAVSPRLLFPDGRIQHAGIVLGLSGAADFAYSGAGIEQPGYAERLACEQEVAAASAACLLVKASAFRQAGGFDEQNLGLAYGDVDFCVRLREQGHRILWTPAVSLLHETGHSLKAHAATPEAVAEQNAAFAHNRTIFVERWLQRLAHDPYYNPGHSLQGGNYPLDTRQQLMRGRLAEARIPHLAALPADASGSGHYRVAAPARLATRETLIDGRILPGYPDALTLCRLDLDVLFTQRQVDDNHLHTLAELRRLLPGLRVVMDFDDLLTEVPRDSAHAAAIWPDIERRVAEACRLSDRVTVSTAPLAAAFARFHDDVRVLPNGIDPLEWPAPELPPQQPGKRLRVGWAGGISHTGDLALLAQIVPALAREVEWVFFGMRPPGVAPALYEYHPGVPFADYRTKLASLRLDLALAPLASHAFNECKSNLRLLEYGILGIPVLASDLTPYQCGLPVTLLGSRPEHWLRAIRERLGEQNRLRLDGEALRNAVIGHWSQDRFLPAWLDAWQQDAAPPALSGGD